ncbi:hypothetical protein ACWGB8_11275 [Kitasatospora sp. NPDC054939]
MTAQQLKPLVFIARTLAGQLDYDGHQPGDPVKAARAIVDVTETADPPLRLQLGADAVERVEAKLDLVRRELDRWRHVALATSI